MRITCAASWAVVLFACSPLQENPALLGEEGDVCADHNECGSGLVCNAEGECAEVGDPGTAGKNQACSEDGDCRMGLVCRGDVLCAPQQSGAAGDTCFTPQDCQDPLVCGHDGACAAPDGPGTGMEGSRCEDDEACAFGMVCTADGVCGPLPRWSGVDCDRDADDGPPRLLFEVRQVGERDFFSLPFPNDIRRTAGGGLDLSGFPGVGAGEEPGAIIDRYLPAVTHSADGFSPNSAVLFRFSTGIDYDTLVFAGDDPTFAFVDVTPGESIGRRPRSRFFATTDRDRYICHNWLGIRPTEGSALEAGHTYAVYFKEGLKAADGTALVPDEDFAAVMGPSSPTHPALADAWQRYAPFRSWLATEGIPAEEVLGAAVFTVGHPQAPARAIRDAVYSGVAPTVEGLTLCDGGTPSPCGSSRDRACGDLNPFYAEIHGMVKVPGYLQGTPPFTDAGGNIVWEAGRPRLQRQDSVCAAFTVPLGDAPAGGWPVVLFAHDVGDHYRSFVSRELATRLARLGWAVVSFDGVLQGDRAGDDRTDPGIILERLENLEHPNLQRDHGLQALADLFSVTRALRGTQVRNDLANGGFNVDKMVFFGHGRGALPGMAYITLEGSGVGAVFANPGAGMLDLLRLTRAPVNLGAELEIAFADPELNGMHPGLHLVQTWLDPRDPVNFGPAVRRPEEGIAARNILMLYGVGDEQIARGPQTHFAVAARLESVGPVLEEMDAVRAAETNRGNVRTTDGARTQVVKQYDAGDGDAHDIAFESEAAIGDLNQFFTGLFQDPEGLPTIQ